ncbi:MAG: SDR family NAD(P)-dependent oxidoreductase [Sphingomonas sp.]|nr:MAG: SDR family NAD(P)-dependent oxidoreductase [Sphingomonas sp.]
MVTGLTPDPANYLKSVRTRNTIMTQQRTVIVTGAGTGIGQATAAALKAQGWQVFATMRRPDPARHGPDALPLDVTSDESVAACVAEVMKRTGRIDAIVNNAGVDMVGAAEETSMAEAHALFETNFFGVHRLIQAVLPIMRAQGSGRIVTTGSIAGFLPTPFSAFYSAAKHALEGYTDTLAFEVAPFGIRCSLIQPGFIKTELRGKKAEAATRIDAYTNLRNRAGASFDANVGKGIPPERVAETIAKALNSATPKPRYRVGRDAAMLHIVRRYMPGFVFQAGLKRQF